MESRRILAEHPSVQDLQIGGGKVNHGRVMYNNMVINSGPLTNPTNGPRKAKKEGKDQVSKVFKHEKNIQFAANRPRSNVNAGVTTASKSIGGGKPPLVPNTLAGNPAVGLRKSSSSAAGGASSVGLAGSVGSRTSWASSLKPKRASNLTADKLPGLGRQASIVTSVESYDGTDAESFTEYSCSCCAIRPPSSAMTGRALSHVPSAVPSSKGNYSESVLEAYENMTSISQRIAQQHQAKKKGGQKSRQSAVSGVTSVASTKLRELESQLEKERQDRKKTQDDLQIIQERQALLMSKLSDREKEKFDEAMKGQ